MSPLSVGSLVRERSIIPIPNTIKKVLIEGKTYWVNPAGNDKLKKTLKGRKKIYSLYMDRKAEILFINRINHQGASTDYA